ncbi:N-acetylmuramoyl-L-alanine amidase [Bacillus sp. RG28]|uniref:N-acetylmuramoyl-L-alanine amidase n=1 Tax=Gottfriedia endophytica TaxID=2820819 RepID=A0A940SKH7_9BACI|nr:N-acetylmuramoyl-L-alanine amidase [Gottfriedia endophytica]MBP0727100.1 N-acetylmuramoyl-L-alanine amidase [Gottfriedia endophytica]
MKINYIQVNQYTRPGIKLKGVKKIVMHYTADPGATAQNEHDYFNGPAIQEKRFASAHIFIDKNKAICIIPLDEVAYHANDVQAHNSDGSPYRGVAALKPNANFLSIGIEMCIEKDGSFHPDTVSRAVDEVAALCKQFNLDPLNDIVRHYDVTKKVCAAAWVKSPALFDAFKKNVNEKLNAPKALGKITIIADHLNLRDQASMNGNILKVLNKGEVYTVLAEKDGFYNVGQAQWCSASPKYVSFKAN